MFCFGALPPAERLRNFCTTCVVLDAIFLLINSLYTINSSRATAKTACYEAHGDNWHYVITLAHAISTSVAAGGAWVHSAISCGTSPQLPQTEHVTRFAYLLIIWTMCAAVIESYAAESGPVECKDPPAGYSYADADDRVAEATKRNRRIWTELHAVLSLAWIIASVVTAIFGRRVSRLLPEVGTTAAAVAADPGPAAGPGPGPAAEVVGRPLAPGAVLGAPMGAPASGWPGGDGAFPGVAQGRPVPGSTHDPDRPTGTGAKVAD